MDRWSRIKVFYRVIIACLVVAGIGQLCVWLHPEANRLARRAYQKTIGRLFAEEVDLSPARERLTCPALPKSEPPQETSPPVSLPLKNPRIEIHKARKIARLFDGDDLIREYPVAFGDDPVGDKTHKGDEKTPEGNYFICTRTSPSRFHLFLGINYPNGDDAKRALKAKSITSAFAQEYVEAEENKKCPDWSTPLGGAIGLHGGGTLSNWTDGCIAFENDAIEEIWLATSYWTPVVITR